MCVSVHGFSWVSHGCNRPWLYVGADRIVSSRVWHGLTSFFFTGPCRSIESQQDCEEHRLVMESDWQWKSRGLVAFGLFTFRYVKVNFSQNKDSILLDTCMEYFSSFTSCRKPPSLPLPSCFHPMSEIRGRSTGPRAEHLSNTTSVLQVSNINSTPWFHLRYTISKPGATDARAKHQAFAPSGPMQFHDKLMFILLTFNASARAWGRQRWQTISCLRIYDAICDNNIQPCPPPNIWSQDHESKSMLMSRSLVLMSADDLPAGRFLAFLNWHPM